MLLVDDHQSEIRKRHGILYERVRPDNQRRLERCYPRQCQSSLFRTEASSQQHWRDAERSEQAFDCPRVLLGEQFSRRHQRGLRSVLHRQQRSEQRNHRLATANIALQQAMHAPCTAHVGDNLPDHAHLSRRQGVRQRRSQFGGEVATVRKRGPTTRVSRNEIGPPV